MRKWLLRLAFVAVGAVLLGLFGLVAANVVTKRAISKVYSVEVRLPEVPTDPESIEEGRRLVSARSCAECHGSDLGGKAAIEDPGLGMLWAPNITKGKGGLPSSYSREDWVRAIRHGLKTDGTPILLMPSDEFVRLSERDLGALIAYLEVAPPVDRENRPHEIKTMLTILTALDVFPMLSVKKIDHSSPFNAASEPAETPEFGGYLASVQCVGCHGAGLSGGPFPGAPPSLPKPTNLTPDPETGLGKWSRDDFERALRKGKRPDGSDLNPFMPWKTYQHLTDTEVGAIWAYLRTVPAKPFGGR